MTEVLLSSLHSSCQTLTKPLMNLNPQGIPNPHQLPRQRPDMRCTSLNCALLLYCITTNIHPASCVFVAHLARLLAMDGDALCLKEHCYAADASCMHATRTMPTSGTLSSQYSGTGSMLYIQMSLSHLSINYAGSPIIGSGRQKPVLSAEWGSQSCRASPESPQPL